MTDSEDWTHIEDAADELYQYDLIDSSHFLATLAISSVGLCFVVKFSLGTGNKVAQIATIRVLLFLFLAVVLSQLIQASLTLPNRSNYEHLYRWDCLYSDKGGKARYDDNSEEDMNPCYCAQGGIAGTLVQIANNNSLACSLDPNAIAYLDGTRDCSHSRGSQCSKSFPCTPCEIDKRSEFGDTWMRCRSCLSPLDKLCDFVEGVGPYCYMSAERKEIGPCSECCTDSDPYFDDDGQCY